MEAGSAAAAGRGLELPTGGRRGMANPRPESVSSAGLHHGWAREREEVERGTSNGKLKCELKGEKGGL